MVYEIFFNDWRGWKTEGLKKSLKPIKSKRDYVCRLCYVRVKKNNYCYSYKKKGGLTICINCFEKYCEGLRDKISQTKKEIFRITRQKIIIHKKNYDKYVKNNVVETI